MRSILFAAAFFMAGCATSEREPEEPIRDPVGDELDQIRDSILVWAPIADQGGAKVRLQGQDHDGDATLFNGLLCSVGDLEACTAVKAMQGPDGRVWRSPARVGVQTENSFSRDMALGGLLYIQATGDVAWADRWVSYIKAEKQLCPAAESDGRCKLTPVLIGMFNYLAEKLGFAKLSYIISFDMRFFDRDRGYIADKQTAADDPRIPALDRALSGLVANSPSGFQLHLLAVEIWIKSRGGDWNDVLQKAADRLAEREPKNAFFRMIQKGKDTSVAGLVLELAPRAQPTLMEQWSWERTDAESAWLASCGWDFLFVTDYLRGVR